MDDKLPKFLCIGAQKAATSWLWVMLRQHPNIWMPPFKEIHFFDYLFVPENRKWIKGHIKNGVKQALKWHTENNKIDLNYFKYLVDIALYEDINADWYKSCFDRNASTNKLIGDITPEYCTIPENGIEYVKELLGNDVKIIYIVRHPVDRAVSQLKMNLSRQQKNPKSKAEWMKEASNEAIFNRGDYEKYIPLWKKYFGKNLMFIKFNDVKSKPTTVLTNLLSFLNLDKFEFKNSNEVIHKTKEVTMPDFIIDFYYNALENQINYLEEQNLLI